MQVRLVMVVRIVMQVMLSCVQKLKLWLGWPILSLMQHMLHAHVACLASGPSSHVLSQT